VAVVQHTFTQKQYTEQHNETEYTGHFASLTFSVRHLNAIKSTAGRSFLGIKPLPALQQM
jgi:hypothetical protein